MQGGGHCHIAARFAIGAPNSIGVVSTGATGSATVSIAFAAHHGDRSADDEYCGAGDECCFGNAMHPNTQLGSARCQEGELGSCP